jgi:hypothetical protein
MLELLYSKMVLRQTVVLSAENRKFHLAYDWHVGCTHAYSQMKPKLLLFDYDASSQSSISDI